MSYFVSSGTLNVYTTSLFTPFVVLVVAVCYLGHVKNFLIDWLIDNHSQVASLNASALLLLMSSWVTHRIKTSPPQNNLGRTRRRPHGKECTRHRSISVVVRSVGRSVCLSVRWWRACILKERLGIELCSFGWWFGQLVGLDQGWRHVYSGPKSSTTLCFEEVRQVAVPVGRQDRRQNAALRTKSAIYDWLVDVLCILSRLLQACCVQYGLLSIAYGDRAYTCLSLSDVTYYVSTGTQPCHIM